MREKIVFGIFVVVCSVGIGGGIAFLLLVFTGFFDSLKGGW